MKKKNEFNIEKNRKVVKGRSSAMILSIAIHVGAFVLAGTLVVFQIVNKEEKVLVAPPPVDRPKMKLKKPQVKVKKTSKPKSTQRIVSKGKMTGMPELALPEFSGIGMDVGPDLVGFDELPEIEVVNLFAGEQSVGNDFEGTFYDLKRTRGGGLKMMSKSKYASEIRNFLKNDWKPSTWSSFYRSPAKRYNTTFCIPTTFSTMAPDAFGEYDVQGYCWAMHFKGELVYPYDMTLRFWAMGDDMLAVRVNGETVIMAPWWVPKDGWNTEVYEATVDIWSSNDPKNKFYSCGNNFLVVGDWFTIKAGEPVPMEVLIGEAAGGIFGAMLMVEVEGEEYELAQNQAPILPIFKTEELSQAKIDAIYKEVYPGECDVLSGPVFNDFTDLGKYSTNTIADTTETTTSPEAETVDTNLVAEVDESVDESPTRTWTMVSGQTFEAEYVALMSQNAVMKTANGKQTKIPFADLSPADQLYIELNTPPTLDLNFKKTSSQKSLKPPSPLLANTAAPRLSIYGYNFGVSIKQKNAQDYNLPLNVEFIAIATERRGNALILADRQQADFELNRENGKFFEFKSPREVTMMSKAEFPGGSLRGEKYYGYAIIVKDSRGEVIACDTSPKFLGDIIDELCTLPINAYFNEKGERILPTPLQRDDRPMWDFLNFGG